MATAFITVETKFNRIPDIIATLAAKSDEIVDQAAHRIKDQWSADVRVSAGPGNFGESHYRDNIAVMEGLGQGQRLILTWVPYAIWNEFGGSHISARPSAQMAAQDGFEWCQKLMNHMVSDLSR